MKIIRKKTTHPPQLSRRVGHRRRLQNYSKSVYGYGIRRFVVIESEDPFIEDLVLPVDNTYEIDEAIEIMRQHGITELPVFAGDPDSGDTVKTNWRVIA